MRPTVADIIDIMDDWAPPALAKPGDSVGLQVGDPAAPVDKVAVSLDAGLMTIRRAVQAQANMLITHHPLYRLAPPAPTAESLGGRAVLEASAAGLALFAAHTNLDAAPGGVNDTLAGLIGLNVEADLRLPDAPGDFKMVVFVPAEAVAAVREAAAGAGAGVIGAYEKCSFGASGEGTFLPREGAHPASGEVGRLNEVPEIRLEMLVPAGYLPGALNAVRAAHPYEEPVCDVYALEGQISGPGLGRIGRLDSETTVGGLAERCRQVLDLPSVRVVGDPARAARRVAVGSGKSQSLIPAAVSAGADVMVLGDVTHHVAVFAEELGMALVDAGHAGTERVILPVVADRLRRQLEARQAGDTEVIVLEVSAAPWEDMPG